MRGESLRYRDVSGHSKALPSFLQPILFGDRTMWLFFSPVWCDGFKPQPRLHSEGPRVDLLTVIFSVLGFWQCQCKISPLPLEASVRSGFNTGSFYRATASLWKALFCRWACGCAPWVSCDVAVVHKCRPVGARDRAAYCFTENSVFTGLKKLHWICILGENKEVRIKRKGKVPNTRVFHVKPCFSGRESLLKEMIDCIGAWNRTLYSNTIKSLLFFFFLFVHDH